ncbi:alpha/beta hydrolase [Glycocaulis sp.]|uniref:alpha/beta hydrolase n=1 Tax=Glycocaulis sp. TaxID=1969725 RepID=UPI003D1BCF63
MLTPEKAFADLAAHFTPERTAPGMREALRRMIPITELDPPGVEVIEDLTLPGPSEPIPVRVWRPFDAAENGAGLVYYHGGGFVVGDIDTHAALCQRLAAASGVRVVSVDYRKAPEHAFPAAVNDALAAFDAVHEGALAHHGFAPGRLAVGGDSAGGNLAAVIAQHRRGKVAFQLLFYPLLQLVEIKRARQPWQEGPLLSREVLKRVKESYLRSLDDVRDVRVSPLLADDLKGLAPAFILAAELDPLVNEGAAYADRLAASGVPVERVVFNTVPHGFLNMTRILPQAVEAIVKAAKALEKGLA